MPSDPSQVSGMEPVSIGASSTYNQDTVSAAPKGRKYSADEVWGMFRELQSEYTDRNNNMAQYERFFDGDHWDAAPEEEDDTSFQLTFNFCRAVVMKFSAILSPLPRLRIPIGVVSNQASARARARERYLRLLFDELAVAWLDIETNASKKSFGVLQAIWEPEPDQPAMVQIGEGLDKRSKRQYTEMPFKFRSIPPERFFPVWRTYDTPDNYLYVIRYDPDRLIEDIEDTYDISLQPTGTSEGTDGTTDLIELWTKDEYYLIAYTIYKTPNRRSQEGSTDRGHAVELKYMKHKYGRPPFFLLQNIRNPDKDPCDGGTLGDIDMISDLNKHYNLIMSEAAEEIVTNIHRPMAYMSDDHQQDPSTLEMKPGAVYPIGAEEKLEPIAWAPMPEAVQQHIDQVLSGLKDLSFLGDSGFGAYPAGATGVGLRIILQSLEQIIALKLPLRISLLRSLIKFLLKISAIKLGPKKEGDEPSALGLWAKDKLGRFSVVTITAEDIGRDYFADLDYGSLLPSNTTEDQQNEIYKFKTGAQSLWTTLDNLGVEDPDTEIERLKEEMKDPVLNTERVAAQLQLKMQEQQMAGAQNSAPQGMPPGPVPPGAGGMPGSASPTARPPQAGPSMNAAPPVPAGPEGAGPGAAGPMMSRTPGPNMAQGMPGGPGIFQGGK